MKFLTAMLTCLCLIGSAFANEPPAYNPVDPPKYDAGPPVYSTGCQCQHGEKCQCGLGCKCPTPLVAGVGSTGGYDVQYRKVCNNGQCSLVPINEVAYAGNDAYKLAPLTAAIASETAPTPTVAYSTSFVSAPAYEGRGRRGLGLFGGTGPVRRLLGVFRIGRRAGGGGGCCGK